MKLRGVEAGTGVWLEPGTLPFRRRVPGDALVLQENGPGAYNAGLSLSADGRGGCDKVTRVRF